MGYRVGIDIGGTFTDFVLVRDSGEDLVNFKTPSTPDDPARAVLVGLRELLSSHHVDPAEITYFVHGTTLGVNTLIQRNGARTALLVTKGFKDVLDLGRLRLADPTNLFSIKAPPLVPRSLVREVDERLNARGEVLTPLMIEAVDRTVDELVADGVEAVAVCFLHSYRNAVHERMAVDLIRSRFPRLYVSASAEVWPQQREYERAVVTVINAYIGNRSRLYFEALARNVAELGISAAILTTRSNGGIMTAAAAHTVPVEALLSGPASGVIGALYIGRSSGYERLITLDIGGTSADVAIIDGDVLYSTSATVGSMPVIMPAVDVSSIGAGGGSIAWLAPSGALKVGPRSAGAHPGPACYANGGMEPTVTDAYVAAGIIDPAKFLGGRLPLDPGLAQRALDGIGARLGLDHAETASSVLDVTTANMYAQLLPLMARRGIDPRDFALLAYGGAGPTHALLLAKEVGIKTVIVPPSPGTLCALGCLVADIKHDVIKTLYVDSRHLTYEDFEMELASLVASASRWLSAQNAPVERSFAIRSLDMRYKGQSFDITVPLPDRLSPERGMDHVREMFHRAYQRVYEVSDPAVPVEIINLRVTIVGVTSKPGRLGVSSASGSPATREGRRSVVVSRQRALARVVDLRAFGEGTHVEGPAVVESEMATVFIPAGYTAAADRFGNIVVNELP